MPWVLNFSGACGTWSNRLAGVACIDLCWWVVLGAEDCEGRSRLDALGIRNLDLNMALCVFVCVYVGEWVGEFVLDVCCDLSLYPRELDGSRDGSQPCSKL